MDRFGISRIVIFSLLLFLMPNFDVITVNLPKRQPLRFLKPFLNGRNILNRKTNEDYVQVAPVELLPQLESSIVPSGSVARYSKNLPPNLLSLLFTSDQKQIFGCTCADPSPLLGTVGRGCITTCLTSETLCYGQTCTRTTTFSALYSLLSVDQLIGGQIFPISLVTSTQFLQFFDKECELLESQCILSSASAQAKLTGALGVGAAIAVSVGIAVDKKTEPNEEQEEEEEYGEHYQEQEYSQKFGRKSKSYFENLKSSMVPIDEQLDAMPRNLLSLALRRIAQPVVGTCSCSVSIPILFQQECTTTCLSSERLCGGHFCTRTSVFNAFMYPTGGNSELTTQTFLTVNNKDCEKLTADCIGSSAIGAVAKIGAAAGLAVAALSSGMGAAAKLFITASNKSNGTAAKEDGRLHSNYTRRTAKKLKMFDSVLQSNSLFDEIEPFLESSIVQEKNLKKLQRNNLFGLFGGRQQVESTTGCTCDDPSPSAGTIGRACSTTCTNSETLCSGSRTCYRTTTFMAVYSLITGRYYQAGDTGPLEATFSKKYFQIDESDCEILESQCSAQSSLFKAIQSSGVVVALSLGLAAGAVGIALMKAIHQSQSDVTYEEYGTPQYFFDSLRREEMQFLKIKDGQFKLNRKEREYLPSVESSIIEESKLKIPFSFFKFSAGRKGRAGSCSCDIIPGGPIECSTTCFSSEQPCGGSFCTRTSAFAACLYLGAYPPVVVATHSFLVVDNKDCDKLEIDCSVTSSAIAEAGRVAAVAAGVSGVLSAGIAVAAVVVANNDNNNNNNNVNNNNENNNQNEQLAQISNQTPANNLPSPVGGLNFPDDGSVDSSVQFPDGRSTPSNNLPFPVVGLSFPDDGSGDSSIRFPDGSSHPIFSRGPCNQNQWVTVDPISLQGGCTLRLCEEDRVFVGRTGLCHHVNDPLECQGGRRLYYTAYGDPICDCPIGQYPFPDSAKDDCVSLFSRGPCPNRQVLVITEDGRLNCKPLECQSINEGVDGRFQQLVPDEKGTCFALGSQGPCPFSQLLGYDIFKRQLQCVVDPFSPESSSFQQQKLADGAENKELYSRDYLNQRIEWVEYLFSISLLQSIQFIQPVERQNTAGILQIPSSLPDSLLQPCRPGARQGENFKCANPLVSDSGSGGYLPPVPSSVSCPADSFLTASGSCVDDSRAASCGPSTRFNEATGQCRPLF